MVIYRFLGIFPVLLNYWCIIISICLLCLSEFCVNVIRYQKEASYLIMLSEVSVHHEREVMVEQLTSWHPKNREK
jgi:hypothetical protein